MEKFTIDELKAARFPVTAFEVSLAKNTANSSINCSINPVTLTGVKMHDVVTFIDKDGVSSYGNPIMFFRTELDAQGHIDRVYRKHAQAAETTVKMPEVTFFVITGRVVGDDEDSVFAVESTNGDVEVAKQMFKNWLVRNEPAESLPLEIIIMMVASSKTPITIVEQVFP